MIDAPGEANRILESALARKRRWLASREAPPPPAKRKHAKRHGVQRRRAQNRAKQKVESAVKIAAHVEARRRHDEAMRIYFSGEQVDLQSARRHADAKR